MNKKKVIHITQATGGVKTYTAYVLDYADSNQFDFVIIAPADVFFEKFCRDKGIVYYPVNLERGLNPFANVSILIKIIRIIKKEKPDIVHAHSAKGGFLGRLAGKLTRSIVIYTPHGFSYLSFSGLHRVMFYFLELVAKKWTKLLLAISHSEAGRSVYELGFTKERVKVILNSIDSTIAIPLKDYGSCTHIRMIGRLTLQKNPLLFLEIADNLLKIYPFLKFSILGAGIHDDLTEEINFYLREKDLSSKIEILNWGDQETSRHFTQQADIFLMTSIFEGLPYSLLEAMSLGVPCVVTDVDGNKDVIRNNENGFSCNTLNQFCEKITALIESSALREKIGQAGRNYVKDHHSIQHNIKQLEGIYINL